MYLSQTILFMTFVSQPVILIITTSNKYASYKYAVMSLRLSLNATCWYQETPIA